MIHILLKEIDLCQGALGNLLNFGVELVPRRSNVEANVTAQQSRELLTVA